MILLKRIHIIYGLLCFVATIAPVFADGRTFLEGREVALNELFQALQSRIQGAEDRLVTIKADRSVILNQAVAVMDVAKAAGAGRLCLATEKDLR